MTELERLRRLSDDALADTLSTWPTLGLRILSLCRDHRVGAFAGVEVSSRRHRHRRGRYWWGDWHRGNWSGSWSLDNLNRPDVMFDRDIDGWFLSVGWGNGNSDPVWSICYTRRHVDSA